QHRSPRQGPGWEDGYSSARTSVYNSLDLIGVELELTVSGAHRRVDLVLHDHDRNADLRGRDHLDVGTRSGDRVEEAGGHTRVGTHARTDQRDLADLVVVAQGVVTNLVLHLLQCGDRFLTGVLGDREGDVGAGSGDRGDVLHDHVDVDLGVRECLEDRRGLSHLIGHTDDGDLGFAPVVGDPGDDRLFHAFAFFDFRNDPGPGLLAERRTHVERNVVLTRVFDTAQVQDLGSAGGHLQHFLVGKLRDTARARHDARIGGEDAVDVAVDLTGVGVQGTGERDGGRVGTATAQRGDVLGVLGDALESGDDTDRALAHGFCDSAGRDIDDFRVAVQRRRDDTGLGAGEGARLVTEVLDGHRHECHGHALTRRHEHVELASRRHRGDLFGQVQQFVGRVAHRGDDDHDVMSRLFLSHDPLGYSFDGFRVTDGRPTVLLHDQGHDR